jgi:hypothetical protein
MEEISFEQLKVMLAELIQSQKETSAMFKETDLKFKESDAEFKEIRQLQKETNKQIKELGKQIGGIGEKFGSFTEGLAYPSLQKILLRNYGIDNTTARFERRFPNGDTLEFDAFGYTNGNINNAVVVEVKSHLQSKHIYQFKKELEDFRDNFPEFSQKHLYGILATVRIVPKELQNEIYENGLHLAIIHDEIFDLKKNPKAIDFNAA